MKQSAIIKAYRAINKLGQQDLPIRLAFDLFQIKQALQPHWNFQLDAEGKAITGGTVNADGSVSFDNQDAAAACQAKLQELADIDVDLQIKPARIPLSTPGLTLSMDDIAALDGFIKFTT